MPESRKDIVLTQFAGRAGDRNDRAMVGSRLLTASLATRFGVDPVVIGEPRPALSAGWEQELTAALPELRQLAQRYQQLLENGSVPVTTLSRCAVALATLPVVAAHRSDTVFVWFDAHADLNTPQTSTTGYLGGLAFSGSLGLWDSGLGNGVLPENAVLVGARDIDPPEQQLIDNGAAQLIMVGRGLQEELRRLVDGRPVYVHIDCEVLEPGVVPTEYLVPGGLSFAEMRQAAEALAESEIIGIQIAELEATSETDNNPEPALRLLDALEPIFEAATGFQV